MEGIKQIEKEKRENDKKDSLTSKIKKDIPVTKPEENKKHEMKKVIWKKMNQRFVPLQFQNLNFQKNSITTSSS